jgi:hypothetical protein
MTNLKYDLLRLCKRLPQGSYATQAARRDILELCANQLEAGGFRCLRATGLQEKHVLHLLERWKSEGLSAGTIKNRLAHMRWWAGNVGKAGVIPADNAALGVASRQFAGKPNKAQTLDERLNHITCPNVHMSLRVQAAFGLRKEEGMKLKPDTADHGDKLVLQSSWCKGGRPREIPIRTAEQRTVLDEAKMLARGGSLIPPGKTFHQQEKVYEAQCRAAGLNKMHGLRYQYAQERYEELTGRKAPKAGGPAQNSLTGKQKETDKAARLTISKELGHNRLDIMQRHYIG